VKVLKYSPLEVVMSAVTVYAPLAAGTACRVPMCALAFMNFSLGKPFARYDAAVDSSPRATAVRYERTVAFAPDAPLVGTGGGDAVASGRGIAVGGGGVAVGGALSGCGFVVALGDALGIGVMMITALGDEVGDATAEGLGEAVDLGEGVAFGVRVGEGVGESGAADVAAASGVTDGNGVGTATAPPFPRK